MKKCFVMDSPFTKEGFRLYHIKLRLIEAEQRVNPQETADIISNKKGLSEAFSMHHVKI